jgi:Mn-dependent DtxR family transcriptional regulator
MPTDAAVLATLGSEPEFVGDAEVRIAERLDIAEREAHAILSRLFDAGHIRFARHDGVMIYEQATRTE